MLKIITVLFNLVVEDNFSFLFACTLNYAIIMGQYDDTVFK